MQCVKATFINFLLKPKQLFGLPQVFKLSRNRTDKCGIAVVICFQIVIAYSHAR